MLLSRGPLLELNALAPHNADGQRVGDVHRRVTIDQQQIGTSPRNDPTPISEAEPARRSRCGCLQRFDLGHPSRNKELQFLVQAGAMSESAEAWDRLRYITARQNVYARLVEGHDTGIDIFKLSSGVDVHTAGERIKPPLTQPRTYSSIGGERGCVIANSRRDRHQGRDNKGARGCHHIHKFGGRTTVKEHVCQSIYSSCNSSLTPFGGRHVSNGHPTITMSFTYCCIEDFVIKYGKPGEADTRSVLNEDLDVVGSFADLLVYEFDRLVSGRNSWIMVE